MTKRMQPKFESLLSDLKGGLPLDEVLAPAFEELSSIWEAINNTVGKADFNDYRDRQGTNWLQWEATKDNITVRVGNAFDRIRDLEKQQIALTQDVNKLETAVGDERFAEVWNSIKGNRTLIEDMKGDIRKLYDLFNVTGEHKVTLENHYKTIGAWKEEKEGLDAWLNRLEEEMGDKISMLERRTINHDNALQELSGLKQMVAGRWNGVEALRGKADEVDDMKKDVRNLADWVTQLRESIKSQREWLAKLEGMYDQLLENKQDRVWGPKDYHTEMYSTQDGWRIDVEDRNIYLLVTEEHGGPVVPNCGVRISYRDRIDDEELISTHPFHIDELAEKLSRISP